MSMHLRSLACWTAFSIMGLTSVLVVSPALAQSPRLSVPIACDLGVDCFVQNFVDIDPGGSVRTADCGHASYDGHKGTDFRLLNVNASADVLASAPGTVKAVRDTMPDRLVISKEDKALVDGKECGNGIVVAHMDGWETQYCHIRQGSVAVTVGDKVARGQKLGEVGYSGFAAFPHVHLSLRREGQVVDPFLGTVERTQNRLKLCSDQHAGLLPVEGVWQQSGPDMLEDAVGTFIQVGFAEKTVSILDLELGQVAAPKPKSAALVFYARLINLRKGDRIALRLTGPGDLLVETEGKPLGRNKAQWVAFVGRKLRAKAWPVGSYSGEASLIRDGKIIRKDEATLQLSK